MSATKRVLSIVLAAVMLAAGVGHFVIPDRFMAIMPPYLPWHYELVLLTGALEIAGGLGLSIPRTRKVAAWGVFALLLAMWPANIHHAMAGVQVEGLPASPTALWVRVPLQLVLLAWAWWLTRD
ncbi:DoxX family protein [Nannocystis punicea]|uniref:DoxX family protein n=1 Tax=Nannocystis punicea TaxID=2995304 RepID=A0ABY7HDF0_9BACT|nr:DoxX family protein [Nannocystis poenicansa]WAS97313.1 DoxX family protein [Nannocystis poenicansa]